jgi:prepilin-type processing-associated H-X9-DG protein
MKLSTIAGAALSLAFATATPSSVELYGNVFYADGHIYHRVDSSGTPQPDLGTFPTNVSFLLDREFPCPTASDDAARTITDTQPQWASTQSPTAQSLRSN